MTTVYWTPCYENPDWRALTFFEPEPVLPHIIKERTCTSKGHFTKCPSFKNYYRNMYVIKAPMDMTITHNPHKGTLSIYPQDQAFYNSTVLGRGNEIGENDPFVLSINISYLFIADKNCILEQLPVTYHSKVVADKLRLIQGSFNVAKWFRPLDFAFELLDSAQPLNIKRGDPLFYVRFVCEDKVKLVYKPIDAETYGFVKSCIKVKEAQPGLGLEAVYKLGERIIPLLWFNKKKCPFNWRNK